MSSDKAVLSTSEAWKYVGGRPFFTQLQEAYPKMLEPLAQCKPTGKKADGTPRRGKTRYLRESIDRALKAAQMERRFVEQ